jgi:hypothetical protein
VRLGGAEGGCLAEIRTGSRLKAKTAGNGGLGPIPGNRETMEAETRLGPCIECL